MKKKMASRSAHSTEGLMMLTCAAPAPVAACAAPAPMSAASFSIQDRGEALPPAPPPPPQSAQAAPQQQQQPAPEDQSASSSAGAVDVRDYTQVPREMDAQFEKLDTDSALRPTIINPGELWTKRAQKALLAKSSSSTLGSDEQKKERDAAFDLLDALTKSGALPLEHASLHIVVAATHCFDKTVTETVIQDNVNPTETVERSTLIMATCIHKQPVAAMIRDSQLPRIGTTSPMLVSG
jgi:hypothetical protein